MSHLPRECAILRETGKHCWSGWDTIETANAVGDRVFEFQRRCPWCGAVEVARGAVVPVDTTTFRYAKTLDAGAEPDD